MKRKILNILIVLLVIVNILIGSLVIYKYFIFEKYMITLKTNGATTIERDSVTCDFSLSGCKVTLPSFQRAGGEVIGYSYNANDTVAKYKIGETIKISNNETLYAISSKKNVVTIAKEYDQIDNENVSCTVYNEEKTCKVKLPRFNKVGYVNKGYSTSKSTFKFNGYEYAFFEYLVDEEYDLTDNITLYPRYEAPLKGKKHDTTYYGQIHGIYLEIGKGVSTYNVNLYKKYLEEIYQKAPYLLTNVKVNLLSETSYNYYWNKLGSTGVSYGEVTYDVARFMIKSSLDVKTEFNILKAKVPEFAKNEIDDDYKYSTLVHELGHIWDSYYKIAIKGIKPTEISSNNESIMKNNKYYTDYNSSLISNQSDLKQVYNKYLAQYNQTKGQIEYNGPLNEYAFTDTSEFMAEAFAYYYLKYLVPTGKYKNAYYPDDIKKVIEKYICIAKNNYQQNGCV